MKFYTTYTAALKFGVSERTVRRWCEKGELLAVKLHGRWLIIDADENPVDLLTINEHMLKAFLTND
jgi:excisionase family DNA binding protein